MECTFVLYVRVVQFALSRGLIPEFIDCVHCDVVICLARGLCCLISLGDFTFWLSLLLSLSLSWCLV